VSGVRGDRGLRRRLAASLALALIGVPALAIATATPALADASRSSIAPPCGGVCTARAAVTVIATVDKSQGSLCGLNLDTLDLKAVTLTVSPGVGALNSTTSNKCSSTLTGSFDPYTVANGSYTATLGGDNATASVAFTLAVPARTPATPRASVVPHVQAVQLSWNPNTEVGITGYAITDADGNSVNYTPDGEPSLGSDGNWTATVVAAPGSHSYRVQAQRGNAAATPSDASDAVTVASQSNPSPVGSPSTGTPGGASTPPPTSGGTSGAGAGTTEGNGGTTGGDAGGSSSGGSTASGGGGSGGGTTVPKLRSFKPFTPLSGGINLAPLPELANGQPNNGTGEPTADGTYSPTLTYPDKTVVEATGVPSHTSDTVFGNRDLLVSIAAALVVLMIAGHVRMLARRNPTDY